ncbi:MAG: hypothetical protein WDN45_18290 [Caulobacteraceae bacterium]
MITTLVIMCRVKRGGRLRYMARMAPWPRIRLAASVGRAKAPSAVNMAAMAWKSPASLSMA